MYTIQIKNAKFIAFADMIADMLSNKELQAIVIKLLFTSIEIHISLVFITQSHFAVPKNISLNSRHYFIMKTSNK